MKPKKVIPALMFAALGCFTLVACNKKGSGGGEQHAPEIKVSAVRQSTDIDIAEVRTYDYTSLFTITSDGENVTVLGSYVDSTAVIEAIGEYDVTCTYESVVATAQVNVVATTYSLELSQDTVTVLLSKVAETDFNSYFTATADGAVIEITDDMVVSTVEAKEGDYTYTVTLGSETKTLTVKVIDNVKIVQSYKLKELELSEVAGYDYTELFSLYVDGAAVRVTDEMIDKSESSGATAGQTFEVRLTYTYNGEERSSAAKVRVVADREYAVSPHNVVTYPYAAPIDLTTLFTVKRGDEVVPITPDMISGDVDYTRAGTYTVTLAFGGKTCTATVTVAYGVILEYAASDTVLVKKGTAVDTYAFANDFKLLINGIRFYAIPDNFFEGIDKVDFNTDGTYEVTLKVPYNSKAPGVSSVRFDYTVKTIKYVVTDRLGEVKVNSPSVTVSKTAGKYNVFNNLYVTVDGRRQSLTANPDHVTAITCYAKVLSDEIDFDVSTPQTVRIEVYVYGNDKPPVTVEYTVTVRSNVVITPNDKGVFTGETVFARDLFTVTEDGSRITVTDDMLSGKVDTFNPGVYIITLEYGGVSADAKVTVFDNAMKGTYKTKLTTIPQSSTDDDESGDDGWGGDYWGDDSDAGELSLASGVSAAAVLPSAVDSSAAVILGDLVIRDDGTISYNGIVGNVVGGIDESTLIVKIGSNDYTLHYSDGIIVLNPNNELKLGFSDYCRPLVFFNSAIWNINESVTVNYGSQHVLAATIQNYSIDTFRITKKDGSKDMWYGLYVKLVEKNSADTLYVVEWGEAKYADGFTPSTDVKSSVTFSGETYNFTMTDDKTAKVDRTEQTNPYNGKTFIGTVDGQSAQLVASSGGFELRINGIREFTFTLSYDLGNTKNAYIDERTNTVFLYKFEDSTEKRFSYKFKLDTTAQTFTIEERDKYYGLYRGKDKYIYVDGYGTGVINFDSSNNNRASTQFKYSVSGGVLYMTYVNTPPSFTYGKTAEFYVGEFLNTLTAKTCAAPQFDGETLENELITDGAIVNITQYEFAGSRGSRTDAVVKTEIRDAIKIVTKDGELTGTKKENAISFECVSFNTSGYYKLTIKLSVDGENVDATYTIQIIAENYSGNAIMTAYGNGELSGGRYSLTMDEFGRVTIDCTAATNTIRYIGYAKPSGDNKVSIKAYSASGGYITAVAERIADGLIKLTAVGTESFTEYFTTGNSRVAGIDGAVIREFTVGDTKTYVLAPSANAVGKVVNAEYVEGSGGADSIIKITDGDAVKYYKIKAWGDTAEGIVYLPDYQPQA